MSSLPAPPAPAPEWAWFSDIDGTLIELADTPASLGNARHLPGLLTALSGRVGGALALVSGRPVANVLRLIAPCRIPLAGCHGLERLLPDGSLIRPPASSDLDRARRILAAFAADHPGVVFEDKDVVLGLHFRKVPQLEAACRAAVEQATSGNLGWFAGKMVFEVKPRGLDKGTAIQAFLDQTPFRGRLPVFLGDDLPDEAGFEVARARGGFGVLVGEPRPTRALYRLESVPAVLAWLSTLQAL